MAWNTLRTLVNRAGVAYDALKTSVIFAEDMNKIKDNIDFLREKTGQEGFLINGKIVPSVASNNLTLAIKGLDGNDPSVTNPVYVRIGGVLRTITSALSVTKNAGTNWFNAGGAELATKEIDYFVYLGFNAIHGVVLGFSRIPYATLYSDFSVTTTDNKYGAISIITNASAGDNYVNIGRFAATMSAGAGYTWSVPTFTSKNLIQRPIYETRFLTYTPVGSTGTGTVTTWGTSGGFYSISGNNLFFNHYINITTNGTGGVVLIISLPFAPVPNNAIYCGRENSVTGKFLQARVQGSGIGYFGYDNSYPAGNGYGVFGGGGQLQLV